MTYQTGKQPQPQQPPFLLPQKSLSGGQELRIKEIIHVLFKRSTWILLCAIFGLVLGLTLSVLSYVKAQTIKQYTVRTSIALTTQSQNGLFSQQSRDPNSTDFYLAEDMVDAAEYILMSDTMLNGIIEDVNLLGVTARDISNSMSMNQYHQTQIILINLYWENAAEGVRILESMNKLAPGLLLNTLKLGGVTVINNPTARFVIGGNLNLVRNVALGIIVGGLFGCMLAVIDLILRPTLMTMSDVEKRFHIPLLGTISEHIGETPILTELLGNVDSAKPRSEVADSFLALAYTLKRRLGGQEHACVTLTSAERGEGKTLVTACLAAALSQIGVRVLAVDFDFRNPMLGGLFFRYFDPIHSINALYKGKTLPKEAVLRVNGTLDLLPALLERTPLTLNDAAMDIVRRMCEDYEIILLDTPPVGQMADTMALNELTTQALFTVEYDAVMQVNLKEALNRLNSVDIEVVGAVVNRAHRKLKTNRRDREFDNKVRNWIMTQTKKASGKVKGMRDKLRPKR